MRAVILPLSGPDPAALRASIRQPNKFVFPHNVCGAGELEFAVPIRVVFFQRRSYSASETDFFVNILDNTHLPRHLAGNGDAAPG